MIPQYMYNALALAFTLYSCLLDTDLQNMYFYSTYLLHQKLTATLTSHHTSVIKLHLLFYADVFSVIASPQFAHVYSVSGGPEPCSFLSLSSADVLCDSDVVQLGIAIIKCYDVIFLFY